jgi:hypothetical protein
MLIRKLLAISALMAMPVVFAPATAQTSDPVYECIVGCVASRPNSGDWCVQECNRRFGNETRPNPGTPNVPCNYPWGCPTQ